MQTVEPEKALSGCCLRISAAVACCRTHWELKIACRKGIWTEPCCPLFCSSDSWERSVGGSYLTRPWQTFVPMSWDSV